MMFGDQRQNLVHIPFLRMQMAPRVRLTLGVPVTRLTLETLVLFQFVRLNS